MKPGEKKVAVLLSTFNGEEFLSEQLDSLLAQSYGCGIYIRDDGSTDNTGDIVRLYETKYPESVRVVRDDRGNLGYKDSFLCLLSAARAEYYMFCDQDDVWKPDKVEKSLRKILELESENPDVPCCVFCNAEVSDANMTVLDSSIWHYSHTNPKYAFNPYDLSVNTIPSFGCTMIFNDAARAALDYRQGLRNNSPGHDFAVICLCCCYGKVAFIEEPLMLYRRHSANVSDAHNYTRSFRTIIKKFVKSPLSVLSYYRDRYDFLSALGVNPSRYKLAFSIFKKIFARAKLNLT